MIKTLKALEDSDVLMKGVIETLTNDIKKGGALPILPVLLGTLGSSLIVNLLAGRGIYRTGFGNKYNSGQGMYSIELVKEKDYLEQDKELKKIIHFTKTTSFNKF